MKPTWPQEVWLVRHGESAGNVARDAADAGGLSRIEIEERDVDVPLSERGRVQATALGHWFADLEPASRPQFVLSSPYIRARQTADLISAHGGLTAARVPEGEALAVPGEELTSIARNVDAVLIGPGIPNQQSARDLVRLLLGNVIGPTYVIDALALCDLWEQGDLLHNHDGRVVLTPHAGEMAQLCGADKSTVQADPVGIARDAATRLGSCIVLKGAATHIASPSGPTYVHADGVVGLATAGSGDVLAGIIAGICARGVSPTAAAVWGVFMHGRAGRQLTTSVGRVGFIARELVEELPGLLEAIEGSWGNHSA